MLGPLASSAEPHTYDMCEEHLRNLTVPKGWDVVRLEVNYEVNSPSDDDLMELAEAVKEAARPRQKQQSSFTAFAPEQPKPAERRFEVVSGEVEPEERGESGLPEPGPFAGGPR